MKKTEFLKSLSGLSKTELDARVSELQHELMNLRFRHASGQLQQTGQLLSVRKQIAQVMSARTAAITSAGA